MDGVVFFRLSYFDYSDLQLFAILIFEVGFAETNLMTSAENCVSEPPNLKIFWGRIPPDPPPAPTRLLPSALAIMPPSLLYRKPATAMSTVYRDFVIQQGLVIPRFCSMGFVILGLRDIGFITPGVHYTGVRSTGDLFDIGVPYSGISFGLVLPGFRYILGFVKPGFR